MSEQDTPSSKPDATETNSRATGGCGDPILRIQGVTKQFGGITALDGVDLTVDPGITGLIGPNGAGKTTLFNCLTGFHKPDDGQISLYETDITGKEPPTIAQQGMVRTFQIPRELADMTVFENLLLAPMNQHGERLLASWVRGEQFVEEEQTIRDRAREIAAFFELDHLLNEPAGSLSGGQRKLLEIARALLTDPDIVLLDEPLAGVNPTLEQKILSRIEDLVEDGYSFLLIEHDIDLIMDNCERVVVMHQGAVLTTGPPEEVQSDERVIEAYLGGDNV
ncbi:sulfate-transporting ATPase [Halorubrum coriense DSM 10284]|uniref:Probable branched-chain amino acid transport ATP-binding protein LivG n=1 Tax=Halorubrum coriense DSM 10284 TaxID=1227466 RepID=M0EAG6_9EURY|nr:ABC transporter ATP-binding protein [Halorubrum coriense]ELZ43409.1 sulfate-transporting ATPase [Halorubrum coriense DSM 10284]